LQLRTFICSKQCGAYLPVITSNDVKVSTVTGATKKQATRNDLSIFFKQNVKHEHFPINLAAFFPNVKKIFFVAHALKRTTHENFKYLDQLEQLEVPLNQISELDEDSFNDLVSLRLLFIYGNSIKVLPKRLLWRLKNLTMLDASKNQIDHVDSEFFIHNPKLTYISFDDNNLKELSLDLSKFIKAPFVSYNSTEGRPIECYRGECP